MKFIDLFAGLGGFHLAAVELGLKCALASELNPVLRTLYEQNFGIEPWGDIREIPLSKIPEHDLLCAGFPCQPFSKAGSQAGWKDSVRGTVFYNIIEILEHSKPRFVLLENVAHFVKHDKGNTYEKVKTALQELGYEVDSKCLSPHQFGVPQIRKRMYLVGALNGLHGFTWPEPSPPRNMTIRDILEVNPSDAVRISESVEHCLSVWQDFIQNYPEDKPLPSFPIWGMEFGATYPYNKGPIHKLNLTELRKQTGSFGQELKHHYRRDILGKLPSHAKREVGFPVWKQKFIEQNRALYAENQSWIQDWLPKIERLPSSWQKFEWNCKGEERDIWQHIVQMRASGVRVKRATTSPSLVAMTSTQMPIISWEKRYITMLECARLQSMEKLSVLPSGTSGITAFGNAVNVKVAKLVMSKLVELC